MAERDRYDWERGRGFSDRDRDYDRGSDRDRGYSDRGMMSRGADEVRSWFGDDEARRRREIDEQRDRQSGRWERDYGPNAEQTRREHGWSSQSHRPDSPWEGSRESRTAWGDQRDFVGRSDDWSGSQYSPRGREWYDPGYGSGQFQSPGGARDYRENNWRYSGSSYGGNYTPNQTSSGFSGGYGAGNYESGSYRGSNSGDRDRWTSDDSSSGYRGTGRDYSTTGEGRWSGGQSGSSYGGWSYGSMHAGRGPRNYQRSDERIREDVNERLTADPRIDASDVDVRVQNGEVTLSGTVDDGRTRRLAEEIIEDLPGVRDVRCDLRVKRDRWGQERHQQVGEQSRGREDGSIGHTGDPQRRDDVTTVNVKDAGKR
jgi:osmotically-inducible protein OsmY